MLRWYFRIFLKNITMLRKKITCWKLVAHEPLTCRQEPETRAHCSCEFIVFLLSQQLQPGPGSNCTISGKVDGYTESQS